MTKEFNNLLKLAGVKQLNESVEPKEYLSEGVWSYPFTLDKAKKLQALMSAPIKASEATDKLYNLVGNDDLFDVLDDLADEDPNSDVRGAVKQYISDLLRDNAIGVDDGVKEILQGIAEVVEGRKSLESSHFEPTEEYPERKGYLCSITDGYETSYFIVDSEETFQIIEQIDRMGSNERGMHFNVNAPKEYSEHTLDLFWSNPKYHISLRNARAALDEVKEFKEENADNELSQYDIIDGIDDIFINLVRTSSIKNNTISEEVDHSKYSNAPDIDTYPNDAFTFKSKSSLKNRYVQARMTDNPMANAEQLDESDPYGLREELEAFLNESEEKE